MIGALLYIFIVFPVAYKNYMNNKNITIFVKALNIIITFALYVFFFYELKSILMEITSGNFYPERIKYTLLIFNSFYVYLSYYIYFSVSIFICLIALNLAQGKKSGVKMYFKYFYLFIPAVSNFLILGYYNSFGPSSKNYIAIIIIISVITFVFLAIHLLYKSRFMKLIFESGLAGTFEKPRNSDNQI